MALSESQTSRDPVNSLFTKRMPGRLHAMPQGHTRSPLLCVCVCVAPPHRKIKPPVALLNWSCVLMLTRDFLWSGLPILRAGINPDQEALTMKHVRSLARRLSLGELCQKHIVWLQRREQ